MSKEAPEHREFKGEYADLLKEFAELMDKLWNDHRTSPTKAASEEFYAWGNLDYTVVMSGHRFNELVEIKSKHGNLDIKKDEDGKIDCKVAVDEKEAHKKGAEAHKSPPNPREILQKSIRALTHYYYSRPR
ncbi:MAG: hypothetical protein AB1489_04270 [Acidobacteriota bacterium]